MGTRYVKQGHGGSWEVVKEGHHRATALGATKTAAVNTARRLTRQEGGGEIRVLNRTGKIVDKDTVLPSKR
jgi:hypothetical protein